MDQVLRGVVLGSQFSEKASVINSIFGNEVELDRFFIQSVRREGEVNGRKITLINTTCWWKEYSLKDLPEVVRQELVCSVFLCPPGPHVFLLVIDLSLPFTQEHRISIEEHLGLFGERIWSYVIVLFTRTVSLKDESIEQHIQRQGEDLQQIIQRCGDRYHIFDIVNKGNGVEELLVKIDSVVTVNNGKHFETDDEKLLEMKKKREDIRETAKARQTMVQEKTEQLKVKVKEDESNKSESQINSHQKEIKPVDEKLMNKIEREGSRWESIIMEGFWRILQNSKASSDENVIQRSGEVWRWIQSCEKHSTSGYESLSYLSDLAEDPQNTHHIEE
ncbi:GTPase IMAP family member 7-like [Myxocyprinus asiaticus]|uniref:GTPase IMAP family member 7-like n=1 Tax=Myxocyprinus asiaticus TaxID=70543 RepID=UPI0022215F11|nr:GTPase IMAP family member 7-like [Myxocyprinus asiaticus]